LIAIRASAANLVTAYPSLTDLDLTPLQRQRLQAVLQRRNKEIQAVLDVTQRDQLRHQLHSGYNLNQALTSLELQPEQEYLIKAIEQLTSLKLRALLSRYSLSSVGN
jgi:stress response protein SCP2